MEKKMIVVVLISILTLQVIVALESKAYTSNIVYVGPLLPGSVYTYDQANNIITIESWGKGTLYRTTDLVDVIGGTIISLHTKDLIITNGTASINIPATMIPDRGHTVEIKSMYIMESPGRSPDPDVVNPEWWLATIGTFGSMSLKVGHDRYDQLLNVISVRVGNTSNVDNIFNLELKKLDPSVYKLVEAMFNNDTKDILINLTINGVTNTYNGIIMNNISLGSLFSAGDQLPPQYAPPKIRLAFSTLIVNGRVIALIDPSVETGGVLRDIVTNQTITIQGNISIVESLTRFIWVIPGVYYDGLVRFIGMPNGSTVYIYNSNEKTPILVFNSDGTDRAFNIPTGRYRIIIVKPGTNNVEGLVTIRNIPPYYILYIDFNNGTTLGLNPDNQGIVRFRLDKIHSNVTMSLYAASEGIPLPENGVTSIQFIIPSSGEWVLALNQENGTLIFKRVSQSGTRSSLSISGFNGYNMIATISGSGSINIPTNTVYTIYGFDTPIFLTVTIDTANKDANIVMERYIHHVERYEGFRVANPPSLDPFNIARNRGSDNIGILLSGGVFALFIMLVSRFTDTSYGVGVTGIVLGISLIIIIATGIVPESNIEMVSTVSGVLITMGILAYAYYKSK